MDDKTKVLVVEDSPTMRRQIAGILEDAGYEVLTAEDGELAIQIIREHHPQLVILDIVLPKKNGYQVCRSVKSDPDLAIKVIMVTAKDQEKDRVWGRRQGADYYLAKPVDRIELLAAAQSLISGDKAASHLAPNAQRSA